MLKIYFKIIVLFLSLVLGIIVFNSILKFMTSIMIYIVGGIALAVLTAVIVLSKDKLIYYRESLKQKLTGNLEA